MTDGTFASRLVPPGPPIPPAVSRQAVAWMVALQADAVPDDARADWQAWLQAHPDHRRAWEHLQTAGKLLHGLPPAAAHGVLRGRLANPDRRRALKRLGIVSAGGLLLATAAYRHQAGRERYATRTGERREVMLADGTRVLLNTCSAIEACVDERQRLIAHTAGEILVTTAPRAAPRPPLWVDTPQGRLSSLDARFAVRLYDDYARLDVYEGAVEVRPALLPDSPTLIRQGAQVRYTAGSVDLPQPLSIDTLAWTSGMLVADRMRLDNFLNELARYRPGYLRCALEVAALQVSGSYPVADTDRVLDMLARTLPVRIERFSRYWVTVKPRAERA
ncbi:FecR domain-containing protein [Bordetella genomosp. 10]|nr:FecR domain-containing protein [Bordetella genomosp. 10]